MDLTQTLIGLIGFTGLFVWARWRESRKKMGEPPLIPPAFIQFVAIMALLVFAAHLLALTTGVEWQSPFRPSL